MVAERRGSRLGSRTADDASKSGPVLRPETPRMLDGETMMFSVGIQTDRIDSHALSLFRLISLLQFTRLILDYLIHNPRKSICCLRSFSLCIPVFGYYTVPVPVLYISLRVHVPVPHDSCVEITVYSCSFRVGYLL